MSEQLLDLLIDNPEDQETKDRYERLLVEQGGPQGEIIAAERVLENEWRPEPRRRALASIRTAQQRILEEIVPEEARQHASVSLGWEHGFIRRAYVGSLLKRVPSEMIRMILEAVAWHPATVMVKVLGISCSLYEQHAYCSVLSPLLERPLGNLRSLHLLLRHEVGSAELEQVLERHPKLESVYLSLHGGPHVLPRKLHRLKRFSVHGLSASESQLELLNERQSSLEQLEIRFALDSRTPEQCAAPPDFWRSWYEKIVPGQFPALRSLTISSAPIANRLFEGLTASPICGQLQKLDLRGCIYLSGFNPMPVTSYPGVEIRTMPHLAISAHGGSLSVIDSKRRTTRFIPEYSRTRWHVERFLRLNRDGATFPSFLARDDFQSFAQSIETKDPAETSTASAMESLYEEAWGLFPAQSEKARLCDHAKLATKLLNEGDSARAAHHLSCASALHAAARPQQPSLFTHLQWEILLKEGRPDALIQQLSNLERQWSDAPPSALESKLIWLRWFQGIALLNLCDYHGAQKKFLRTEQVREHYNDDDLRDLNLILLAACDLKTGCWRKAEDALESLRERVTERSTPLVFDCIARISLLRFAPNQALRHISMGKRLSVDHDQTLLFEVLRGLAIGLRGNREEAIAILTFALSELQVRGHVLGVMMTCLALAELNLDANPKVAQQSLNQVQELLDTARLPELELLALQLQAYLSIQSGHDAYRYIDVLLERTYNFPDPRQYAKALMLQAQYSLQTGAVNSARADQQRAIERLASTEDAMLTALARLRLGAILRRQNRLMEAFVSEREAKEVLQGSEDVRVIAALEGDCLKGVL